MSDSQRERGRRPVFVDVSGAVAGLAAVVGVALWWILSDRPGPEPGAAIFLVHTVAGLSAAILAWRVSRREPTPRLTAAWRLLAASTLLFAAGDLLMFAAGPDTRLLAVIHLAVVAPCFVAAAGLFLLTTTSRRPVDRATNLLDIGIVALGAWMVVWELALRPTIWSLPTGVPFFVPALAVADVALVAGAASVLLRFAADERRVSHGFLVASYGALVVSDASALGNWLDGSLHHPGRVLAVALFIVACLLERRRLQAGQRDDAPALRPVFWLPYLALSAAAVMLLVAMARTEAGDTGLAVAGMGMAGLVVARMWLTHQDVLRLRRERTLLAHDTRFRSLVEQSADMIFVVDSSWTVTFASPSVSAALGYRSGHLVGSSVLDLIHPEEVADTASRLRECLADQRPMRGRWRMRRSDQTFLYTESVCTNLVRDEHIGGIVLTARDVSERHALEAQLAHRAFHDPLTGLANRALFEDRVRHALARRRSDVGRLGVVFLDVDHFKHVNDEMGHAAGDALLRAAADRLVSGLRAFDTAARLGGDEFAVLVDDIHRPDEVLQVGERIVRSFGEPFVYDGRQVSMSASVGGALAQPGQSAEDLLRNADLAMYLAKKRGRSQAVLFEPAMHAAAASRQELQRDLSGALERGELTLVYHPIHALDTQAMIGAEALLRWIHPTRGPIPPATFVPIAEESGLIVPIGQWVLRTACMDAQAWRSHPAWPLPLRVWINVSARQLPDEGLEEHVARAIADSGILPGAVVLELTERILLEHKDHALELMTQLKALGVGLAIDDFGTGYTSLSHLQRLPIDILKIDRSFVDGIASDEHASTLARTVVSLGELMSLDIVGEGIENREQAERLLALGCNAGQGYYFGLPMPSADLPAYAERYRTFSTV